MSTPGQSWLHFLLLSVVFLSHIAPIRLFTWLVIAALDIVVLLKCVDLCLRHLLCPPSGRLGLCFSSTCLLWPLLLGHVLLCPKAWSCILRRDTSGGSVEGLRCLPSLFNLAGLVPQTLSCDGCQGQGPTVVRALAAGCEEAGEGQWWPSSVKEGRGRGGEGLL